MTSLKNPAWQVRGGSAAAGTFHAIAAGLCILTALSFFLLPLPTLQWFTDYWEHASAVRVLSENVLAPSNPHYATYDADRQFIPLFVLLGGLMQLTGMGVTAALALGAVVTTALFVVGVKMFADSYFQHRWAPVILIAVLLCCWGTPWVWTGFYEFRAMFYNSFYPAAFVFSLTFITWALVIRALQSDTVALSICCLLPLLSALMFVSHQLGGLFALGGAFLFLLFEPKSTSKTRLLLFTLLAFGVAITWWWPYFNPIELTYRGAGDKENGGVADFYNTVQVVLLLGPAWLGIPLLFELFRKRIHLALVAGFLGVFGAYCIGGALGHPVAHRFLSYAVLYLHLPITWKLLSLIPEREAKFSVAELKRDRPRFVVLALCAALVMLHLAFGALDFARVGYERTSGKSFGSYPNQDVIGNLIAVANKLPGDAIMFASPHPALAITAFKGKVVVRPRPQLMIADGVARSKDNAQFFSSATSQAERRELARKYGVRYILIKKEDLPMNVTEDLKALGEVVPNPGQLVLIKIDISKLP
ncbi:glycosyltransferase family protein [Massilia litorea]|uniref:Glycosyltransferase RgtA/B/C/D-like domain-containing protein n=1 Tax=Massilia litorea TaxID=2769491 RepID=A0A7L9U9S9_9BURK|nr:hypothetical protein [Massilia litorea]QOL50925.1 hypothetical protein LPB04_06470 [Massilia litorea]